MQRAAQDAPLGALTVGDKKDLLLTNRLWGHLDRVAIYGWHMLDGKRIQSLSTVHGWRYADYSHRARFTRTRVFVATSAHTAGRSLTPHINSTQAASGAS